MGTDYAAYCCGGPLDGYCCGGPLDGKWVSQFRSHFEVAAAGPTKWDDFDDVRRALNEYREHFYTFDELTLAGRTDPIKVPIWKHNGKVPTSRQLLAAAASYNWRMKRGS